MANTEKKPTKKPIKKTANSTRETKATRRPIPEDDLFIGSDNPAKSREKGQKRKAEMAKEAKQQKISKNIGIGLAVLQIVASLLFVGALFKLNMLPMKYVALLIVLFVLLDALLLFGQLKSKKNAITGKIISVAMSVIFFFGAFYVLQASTAVEKISTSGNESKVDKMVVAVLLDDTAETIEDAASYAFGVQYSMKGEDVKAAIADIEEVVGSTIDVSHEYANMAEQATALQNGEVQAIIYNEAYAGILEETNPDFATGIKTIYEYHIETAMEMKPEEEKQEVVVTDESFTVYISGIDVYGKISNNSRSDVNIIAQINPVTHEVLLATTPRDYYVPFPGVTGGKLDKLTHAGIYGVDVSIDTLEELYNTEIDFYARVNFTSLIEMVDALGGIEVHSDYAFSTSLSGFWIDKGMNTMSGKVALEFARERYKLPGGDNARGINQQAVIEAMIKKVISPSIITGAYDILDSVSDNVETNMSTTQIQDLIKTQIDEMADWTITSVAATGTSTMDYCYSSPGQPLSVMIPDQSSIDSISAQMKALETSSLTEGGADAATTTEESTEE